MRPTILMTRPDPDGAETARDLARLTGLTVARSPLLAIRPAARLPDTGGAGRLIFTSRNAVRAYRDLGGEPKPAICVGEATAAEARRIGCRAHAMGGDAEAMVGAILADPPADPMIHLRGAHARGDVASRLAAAGLSVTEAVIYSQDLLDLTSRARALLDGSAPVIVPLYSPRTAARFAALANPRAPLYLVSLSAAVNEAAQRLDTAVRSVADRPDAEALTRATIAAVQRVEAM
ncbi:hypothetical protein OB2597_12733 [Pseudooceanicola batsensis HTCC2597]|uniref:Tetrapyrrole biosynthesis uroporphyrinogen III synthase domain-containing protein n=1 Tax=Pseudooceanicola batsensis (strain ATCC BAA-863 / DSM 15984 / KCTC 12145 / HTCC2597) TaxID=252305 RepID=A3TXX5_PSEBH|nr:uroporphyrinogen-III synthase [Pseudooceanicola batsensis]EAQ03009.1 hypothetical protein OB2597_12733 [Pseudooceanicola batsensis HTCC2597]